MQSRTVRPHNEDEIWSATAIVKMKGSPWDAEGNDDEPVPVVEPRPDQMPQKGGLMTQAARDLRAFWEAKGKTAGCKACEKPGQRQHSVACKKRQMEFRDEGGLIDMRAKYEEVQAGR